MEGSTTPRSGSTSAPDGLVVLLGFLAVAAAAILGAFFAINDGIFGISLTVNTEDFLWFALLYVMAQAIERAIEPLMGQVKAQEVADAKQSVAAAIGDAAKAQAQSSLAQVQADRAVIAWATASCIALIITGILNLDLLGAIADVSADEGFNADAFEAANVAVTGLVVGAGTKPLHDLISRIEKSKNNADPETGS